MFRRKNSRGTERARAVAALIAASGLAWVSSAAANPAAMRAIEVTPERVTEGKLLFAVCGSCHGPEGEGRTGIGPRLNSESFLAAASDELLVKTITEGRTGTTMVPWGAGFQPNQIESLVAFMRSWNNVEPATLDESKLKGDAAAGEPLFRSICAACHGRSGGGYLESSNGTGIGRAAFLGSVSDGYLRYVIRQGKSGTPMRGFAPESKVAVANLTNEQIEDVIAYLRGNAW